MAEALTRGAPDRYARLRERGLWALAVDAAANPAQRHQALFVLGRSAAAFAEGELFLDCRPRTFDMRFFWPPRPVPPLPETVRGPRPWAPYYRAILSPDYDALARLEDLPELSTPRYAWLHAPIGRHHLLRSHFAEALAHLRRALPARPFDWRTRAFIGEALLCLGRRPAALAEFSRAVAAAPEGEQRAQARAWRGEANLWLGRYERALADLEAACAAGSLFAYSWRAGAVLKSGDPARALDLLEEAERIFPEDPELPTWRGETLRALGRNAEALRALSAGVPGLWARFNRGLVFAALDDERGFLADYWSIPAAVRARIIRKLSLPADREPSFKGKKDVLAAGLELARGYRREDSYGGAIWLR